MDSNNDKFDITHYNSIELKQPQNNPDAVNDLPQFDYEIYSNLPVFLKDCINPFENDPAKDILLIGLLTMLSGILPNYDSIYSKGEYTESNLKLFVIAAAGEGKGILKWAKRLGQGIDNYLKELAKEEEIEYKRKKADFDLLNKKNRATANEPEPAKRTLLFVPINSSVAGIYYLLNENKERGILFSTEADTMVNILGTDFGDYSTLERQSFHHETAEYYRKTNNEFIELKNPKITTLLSGTKGQAYKLIESVENGLFSRYMYYFYDFDSEFELDFTFKDNYLDNYFEAKSNQLIKVYQFLEKNTIQFRLTENQEYRLNQYYKPLERKYKSVLGKEIKATIRRLCLQTYRIAMILTFFKNTENFNDLTCTDIDFNNAIAISKVLLSHAIKLFKTLPNSQGSNKKTNDVTAKDVAIHLMENTELSHNEIINLLNLKNAKGEILTKMTLSNWKKNR